MKTSTLQMTGLQRAVFGRNLINNLTLENLAQLLPQIRNYEGKKIALASGDKAKIFVYDLIQFSNHAEGQSLRTFITVQYNGKVILKSDVTIADKALNGGGFGVTYHGTEIEIGQTTNGVLTNVETLDNIVTSYDLKQNYDAVEVAEKRAKIEILKDEIRTLERSISHFRGDAY